MPWNITTPPIDRERIRKALNYPAAKATVDQIQTAMDRITEEVPEAIASVQELLDDLDEIDETLETALADSSYAMIKADVVEWEAGGKRTEGMQIRKGEIIAELAATMGLAPYTGVSSGGSDGVLLRS